MADHAEVERAVLEAQTGPDRDAGFRQLYETYFRAVRSFFLRRSFSRSDTEELTQETFFRVYRHLNGYRHRGHFGAWLFTIADSVCRKEWQKRGTFKRRGIVVPYEESGSGSDEGETATSPPRSNPAEQDHAAYGRERRRILSCALAELAERQRQCLAVHLKGYSYQEIAMLLQIAPETVKRHLKEARKKLRQRLGDLDLSPLDDGP